MVRILLGLILLLPAPTGEEGFKVHGTIKVKGEIPAAKPNKKLMNEQACANCYTDPPPMDNLVVDASGGVRWAFVYVKKGLEGKTFEPPATGPTIDQKGCVYGPHVTGAMAGQPVTFKNSDKFMHNVHGIPFTNKEFNYGQLEGASHAVKFPQVEVPVKVVCNVHTFMACYVCVVDHPYFAVTDAAGKFEIKGLPPGTYTLGVWHEELKFPDQVIVVKADLKVDF